MRSILQVPGPVKSLFDKLPLQQYDPVDKRDDALEYELRSRTYDFQGPQAAQKSANDTFQLGVYQVRYDSISNCYLASDPWCLFTQLSLCKKNDLKLNTKGNNMSDQKTSSGSYLPHSVFEVSPLASNDGFLPILIEGHTTRNVRSSSSIYQILNSRLSTSEELMYVLLLDSIVYDCYMTKVLYELKVSQFLSLYAGHCSKAVDPFVYHTLCEELSKRNGFALRHRENATVPARYLDISQRSSNFQLIVGRRQENCQQTLIQFQDLLGKFKFFRDASDPSYLDLKLASYVHCLLHLPEPASLAQFLHEQCPILVDHSRRTISRYK
ncbi:LADA_0F11672g1_1 [Lachancea dasiensis]|uniref:LADA_0F11672g1_1 n=1 Tax=Lachancea dasiensis TaxID=1072105 RepID=A0A1G4JMT0_9SACH|nr:LADA_0F11672g1_1 [Lachancea dasiensis]